MTADPAKKTQAAKVVRGLRRDYADAECALVHDTPFQLLVATVLSAQCTDARVNVVTKQLFAKYPTAKDLAAVPVQQIEKLVQSTGFYRNKAKNLKALAERLVREFDGEVPPDLEILIQLPGVGRKTANVVLGTAFGIPTGVVVDTHVGRISKRLGLTDSTDAVKIEQDLMKLLPRKEWIDYSHRLIHHGRRVCKARNPRCEECGFKTICPRIGVEA
ncbi:MAG TPA: endonuclease III [Pirellulaceae bacterium]|nr:endonuclease III [Pirellulaceae bacterium]